MVSGRAQMYNIYPVVCVCFEFWPPTILKYSYLTSCPPLQLKRGCHGLHSCWPLGPEPDKEAAGPLVAVTRRSRSRRRGAVVLATAYSYQTGAAMALGAGFHLVSTKHESLAHV